MRPLNDTLARLRAMRGRTDAAPAANSRLRDLADFGSNPGALDARYHVPAGLWDGAPLVVVLHGCTQDAGGYDRGSGWSKLADEHGFALLYPEQRRANNAHLCFNWFQPEDTRRDGGEALSIRQMIAHMVAEHRIDPARVHVTGLSAGGAMASVMLATYPEVFAGGAIIAGLPYGTANSVPEAFDRMRAQGGPAPAALGALVRTASSHRGPWPAISVWHGDADRTVSHANSALIVEQWRGLHGAEPAPARTEAVSGHVRRVWQDAAGRDAIEEFRIAGLGHGTPLGTAGPDGCGVAAPYMLEAGISSTHHIAAFWGLLGSRVEQAGSARVPDSASHATNEGADFAPHDGPAHPASYEESRSGAVPPPHDVGETIERALRAAGLMR